MVRSRSGRRPATDRRARLGGAAMGRATDRGSLIRRVYRVKRWMYAGGRLGRLARAVNRLCAVQYAAGVLSPRRAATLEVLGRRSGKAISFPVVVAELHGRRYLVSMLGEQANWV